MILLDNQRQIVSINPAAKALFGLEGDCVGKNMLDISRDSKLTALLDTGFQNHKAERLLHFQDKTYQTLVRPVTSDGELTGVVLLLFDASEEFKNEQMRREFTA
ncbi:PAS domain-containing protein, partial [Streptococcus suis]